MDETTRVTRRSGNSVQRDNQARKAEADPGRAGHGCLSVTFIALMLLVLGAIGLFAAWTVRQVAMRSYEGRIYPNVVVLDVDLGGLTSEEAASRLIEAWGNYDAGQLLLRDGERTWTVPWSEAGLRLDVDATVRAAFAVGRDEQDLATLYLLIEGRREVAPVFVVEPEILRGVLERLAPEVALPPTDATLRLEGNQVVAEPGRPGRALDVQATLDNIVVTVAHVGLLQWNSPFALAFQPVPPQLVDVERAQAQAEEMLNRQVEVVAHDWLTGERFVWTLGRDALITWLRVEPAEDGSGPAVRVAEESARASLEDLAAQLGDGRGFQLEEAPQQLLDVFDAGGGVVELHLTHPPRTAVVQPGDTLTKIAARFGMPPGLIAEANPGVDLNLLHADQQLTVPPEDVLRPYRPVPGKRIVITIAEQRMRVYENDILLYDWPVSTGLPDSPTYTGSFQVLGKEEDAYASQWDLWMPHFIAVYLAGGGVYNGIHALPILANGQRLWEGSLGSPASFGCIILGTQEAETLYNWAEIGVPVTIE